jgi:hypothetical protein
MTRWKKMRIWRMSRKNPARKPIIPVRINKLVNANILGILISDRDRFVDRRAAAEPVRACIFLNKNMTKWICVRG